MVFEGCWKSRIRALGAWWPGGRPVGLVAWRSRGRLVAWRPGGLELRIQPWAQKALKSNSVKRNVKGK